MSRAPVAIALILAASSFAQTAAQSPRARLDAAIAAAKTGRTEAAVAQFRSILRDAPPDEIAGQARLELVRIYERRADWWNAAEQLRELRKMAPQDAEYAYQLGVAYRSLSKWAFERMRATAPESARTQQMLGEQYAVAGDTEKAVSALRRAVAADPKLAGPHLTLAVIYLRQNRRDLALAEIDQELQIAPESAAARQLRQALAGGGR